MFDLILSGADVIDGTGSKRFAADVGIVGDRIGRVGDLEKTPCHQRLRLPGKVIVPGFVDTHTHDDHALILWPEMTMKTSQGVTTVVIGNCGISLAPAKLRNAPPPPLDLIGGKDSYRFPTLASYFDYLQTKPPAVNVVALVGHMTLRASTLNDLNLPADAAEINEMLKLLDEALDAGALGMSTGLAYQPSAAATTDEVLQLLRHVRSARGIHCTHIRDEADGVVGAVCEACAIGALADLPTVISHHKVQGKSNAGLSVTTLALIDDASKRQSIAIDAYPYEASSTVIRMDRVRQSERVQIAWSATFPQAAGRMLHEIAQEMDVDTEEAARRLSPGGAIYFVMDKQDVSRILSWRRTMIGSDGLPHDSFPHPRLWGTFPRVLGHYVRELGLLTLEDAVHRMTGLPADTFGLRDRGCIREGCFADIAVFDPDVISDCATYENPTLRSTGIDLVMVNGRIVFSEGISTQSRPGRVLKRQELDQPMAGRKH